MKKNRGFVLPAVLAALTLLYIVLLKTVDVAAVGPQSTSVGFSHLNQSVFNAFGVNESWYKVTEVLGIGSIALAFVFALMGFIQLMQRKNILKVDHQLLAAGALYFAVIALYVLFEIVVINYRPVIMPGETAPEASFPSSHTMIGSVIMGSAVILAEYYIKNENLRKTVQVILCIMIMVMTFGRLLSGVHWLTDIIGGVLISLTLLSCFRAVLEKMK
ncbi:MAG: phosphatase PAP2 family protein [Erysipelotrichaceae bacterium]|nr:phosphatase PAP2 family protein [Erysipelotrichaceae bacterium]